MSSEKVILSSYNGIQEYQHVDAMKPGDLVIETVQDCQPILDYVKEERERPVGKEWRKVACIPLIFYDEAVRKGCLHDKAYWHKWLNDPDHAAFRVWNGRIGPTRQI